MQYVRIEKCLCVGTAFSNIKPKYLQKIYDKLTLKNLRSCYNYIVLNENIVKKYSDMMASNGGKLLTVNKWGVKKLAYAINFKKEGYYVLFEFENEAEVPAKVTALMNIDENVLRSLCLKKDEKEAINNRF